MVVGHFWVDMWVKISLHIELELMTRLWAFAEEEGIRVFAENLRDLLLVAPAGPRPTIALDPGFLSGVKCAVVDIIEKLVDTVTVYPHEPQKNGMTQLTSLPLLRSNIRWN
jgi:uncharacterized protein